MSAASCPGSTWAAPSPAISPASSSLIAADYDRWLAQMAGSVSGCPDLHDPPAGVLRRAGALNGAHPEPPPTCAGRLPPRRVVRRQGPPLRPLRRRRLLSGTPRRLGGRVRQPHPHAARRPGMRHLGHRRLPLVGRWIIGVEWDPGARRRTGRATGRPGAVPPRPVLPRERRRHPDRALARAPLDELAGEEASGAPRPFAFANWPTTDPLDPPGRAAAPGGPGQPGRQPRTADGGVAGRDVRQLPRVPVLPGLPAAREGAADLPITPAAPTRTPDI